MLRFKNILLVLASGSPGERKALSRAVFVARTHGASLAVAGLVRRSPAGHAEADDVCAAVVRACHDTLEQLVEPFRATGVPITTTVLCGTPVLEIIREVLRSGYDLVMMPAEHPGGIRNVLFGGTSKHLMRKCPCPVWLLKPRERVPYRRVLAAVDPKWDNPETISLNRRILEMAAAIAESEQAELHIAHAWSVEFERVLRRHSPRSAMRTLLRETRRQREAAVWRLAAPFLAGVKPHQVLLRKGDPTKVIPLLARRNSIDLVVLGTFSRTGISGLLIGNTAEQVFGQLDCSILTIKPEGFVTPVRLDKRESLDRAA